VQTINRRALNERLANDDVTLVDVSGAECYRESHLPGAISVPLDGDFEQQIEKVVPDRNKTVVVYCRENSCEVSLKAARQMDELGYQRVWDYQGGKLDWMQAGLPVER